MIAKEKSGLRDLEVFDEDLKYHEPDFSSLPVLLKGKAVQGEVTLTETVISADSKF